ncbi:hypothetical protein [Corynebacterium lowii]|uniref:hypothetical protein n=1 Tax=Corynebacterium lowii TaxID=1544413 RepID=UPI0012E29E3F|nr:hypothetical protein [Corynebacterium lowii]MDP9851803.1 hypothetical protein [Corynebacterium lowii]
MLSDVKRSWLCAGGLVCGVFALIAVPNVISHALPPLHEVSELKAVELGEGEASVVLEDLECRNDSLSLMTTYHCGDAKVSTIAVGVTDDPDLTLRRMLRAAHSSKLPMQNSTQDGQFHVLSLDSMQAEELGISHVDEAEKILAVSFEKNGKEVVTVITGNISDVDSVAEKIGDNVGD